MNKLATTPYCFSFSLTGWCRMLSFYCSTMCLIIYKLLLFMCIISYNPLYFMEPIALWYNYSDQKPQLPTIKQRLSQSVEQIASNCTDWHKAICLPTVAQYCGVVLPALSTATPKATGYCCQQCKTAGVNRKKPISELAASFEADRSAGRCRAAPLHPSLRHPL